MSKITQVIYTADSLDAEIKWYSVRIGTKKTGYKYYSFQLYDDKRQGHRENWKALETHKYEFDRAERHDYRFKKSDWHDIHIYLDYEFWKTRIYTLEDRDRDRHRPQWNDKL